MTAPEGALLHVVPGPERHGVVRHGLALQEHLARGQVELMRCGRLDELASEALAGRVVAVQVTDKVLAEDPESALTTWRKVTRGVARLTVVLHDLPQRSDGPGRRARSRLYAEVAASADEVVVASRHERLLLAGVLRWARASVAPAVLGRTHVVPLPLERAPAAPCPHRDGNEPLTVVTLGFVYPGKGLEEVIDATSLAARDSRLAGRVVEVRNLGRASDGHDDLVAALEARATAAGVTWSTTGWVDDAELPVLLAAATVPVAAHRHLSASGSIATWLAAGRRPVVLRSRYADELAGRLPGALSVVGVDSGTEVVPALAAALTEVLVAALAGDDRTRLGAGVALGPSWAEAGDALRRVACRPAVSVVIPYYRGQPLLDLILDRLAVQAGVLGGLEVVVADDGSPEPPDVHRLASARVVRQERDGFRAAAARNLGARGTSGRVLLFLDGDTVPEDGYVAALQRTCLAGPTLALGRRRHADLRSGGGRHTWPPAEPLEEPAWLADGYRASEDLRAADDASFRFVISAVMAVTRQVWDAVGGFEEELTGYGGEDWELGWRCWLAGAELRHVPEAVAWHDGPDLGGRAGTDASQLAEVKNAETARLAPYLPHPLVRGRGWAHAQPDVVAVVCAIGWADGQVVVVVESLLRQGDVGVWVLPGAAAPTDPRVHAGHPPARVLARARALVEVTRPVAVSRLPWTAHPQDLTGALASWLVDDPGSGVRVTATRTAARGQSRSGWLPADWTEAVPAAVVVERWRQQWSG